MKNTIAVSTWSIHRLIGTSYANGPDVAGQFKKEETWGRGDIDIFDVPAALAERGYAACELCHFHVGSLETRYLKKLADAFDTAGVVLQTLLIDDGDITNPATRAHDLAWIKQWIEASVDLRAQNVRVIAGKQKPTPETLALSVSGLKELLAFGNSAGVQVATENWFDLLSTPVEVHHVLDHVPGLHFMADTGNWSGPTKYADLQSIFPRAQLCHAKAEVGVGYNVDAGDFNACLNAAKLAGYAGPMTLIYADDGDEWKGLAAERACVLSA
jgi:sugar phosphate isomerase/epimerase